MIATTQLHLIMPGITQIETRHRNRDIPTRHLHIAQMYGRQSNSNKPERQKKSYCIFHMASLASPQKSQLKQTASKEVTVFYYWNLPDNVYPLSNSQKKSQRKSKIEGRNKKLQPSFNQLSFPYVVDGNALYSTHYSTHQLPFQKKFLLKEAN